MPNSTTQQAGFYIIRFSDTHYYGGRSKNAEQRWSLHLMLLKKHKHYNVYMQAVFDKYGQRFEPKLVICESDPKTLAQIEQDWLDQNFGQPGCVNMSASAQYNPEYEQACQTLSARARARFADPAEREKMSLYQKGIPKTPETKAKMSAVWKSTHIWSEELKARWSRQRKGQTRSAQARENISNGLKGHPVSAETRAKISASNKAYYEKKRAEKEKKQEKSPT